MSAPPTRARLARNIPLLFLIKGMRWFMLVMPILVLFFLSEGLAMTDVLLLQAVFSVTIVGLEVPSGWVADVWGRRLSLIGGSLFGAAAFVAYALGHGFWQFLAAELLLGVGASLVSGADSAMLFDSLSALGEDDRYRGAEGKLLSVGNFSEAAAAIAGGLLATVSLRTPIVGQAIITSLAIPCSLMLVEPPRNGPEGTGVTDLRALLRVVRFALVETPPLRAMLALSAVMGSSTLTVVWFVQPWLQAAGLPLSAFGVVWAALNATVGLAALRSDAITTRLGEHRTWLALLLLVASGYALMATAPSLALLPGLLALYAARGVGRPGYVAAIQRLTPSDRRATVLSVGNMGTRGLFAVVGPAAGWLCDHHSMSVALVAAGGIHLGLGAAALALTFVARHAPGGPAKRTMDGPRSPDP